MVMGDLDKDGLEKELSSEQIKIAIFQMKHNKASSLDVFQFNVTNILLHLFVMTCLFYEFFHGGPFVSENKTRHTAIFRKQTMRSLTKFFCKDTNNYNNIWPSYKNIFHMYLKVLIGYCIC